jgi:hypothetical protein
MASMGLFCFMAATKKQQDVIATAIKRYQHCYDAENDNRTESMEDREFINGEQWEGAQRKIREGSYPPRPCITINKMPQHRNQITNMQRQNRMAIKVRPVDNGADPKTAEIITGLIRNVDARSQASIARDTAFESAVDGGFGFYRIITQYVGNDGFEQEILIQPIPNGFSAYIDPDTKSPDYSDMRYAFVLQDMPKDDFENDYPKAQAVDFKSSQLDKDRADWITDETVRVAEYFEVVYDREKTICLLENGKVVDKTELFDGQHLEYNGLDASPTATQVKKDEAGNPIERKVKEKRIVWRKITAVDILEERDWPGQFIPIIEVSGEKRNIGNKVLRHGFARHAKDPQRMYNYWASCETERIALSPKAPYIGTAKQFDGHENIWGQANVENFAYLPFNSDPTAPPPQRQAFDGVPAGIVNAKMAANDDIKATTGIYDASLGNRSNETSGRAILARQNQSDTANFHYTDNLTRAMTYEGIILVDLIPRIYDTQRTIRILGEDNKEQLVTVNQMSPDGGKTLYDLTVGKYDVTVTTGPAFASRRAEAAEAMIEFTRANPGASQYLMDLIAENMDWPGADQIAKRLKKLLPPNILDDSDPEKAAAMVKQLMRENQELKAELQKLSSGVQETQMKIGADMQKAQMGAQVDMAKARMGAQTDMQIAQMREITNMRSRAMAMRGNQANQANGSRP